jgi:hypothetical protein
LLLDENVPRQLAPLFRDTFEVKVIHDTPWVGLSNGELFSAASGQIDVLLTCDRNIKYQQNVVSLSFGIVVFIARSNRIGDLLPLVAQARQAIAQVQAAEVIEVRAR